MLYLYFFQNTRYWALKHLIGAETFHKFTHNQRFEIYRMKYIIDS